MICSTLCYVQKGGKTLMLHRNKKVGKIHDDKWNGLGGKMEPGESPEDCVLREVREESGLKISAPKLKGLLTFPSFDGENDWLVFVYAARKFFGKPYRESREGALRWVPTSKLPGLNLWEGDKHFLAWLKGPRLFSAKFVYRKGKFISHEVHFY